MIEASFDYAQNVGSNIESFYFTPTSKVDQIPGQFTELRLPHADTDERGDKRWFTISSSPTEDKLAITTRLLGHSGSSFKRALTKLQPGDKVMFADPMGDFVLPKDKSMPLLFIAGGIGITPMRSMIKWLRDKGEDRDIQLIYAARQKQDLVFSDLFDQYCSKFTPLLSSPQPDWNGDVGLLNVKFIEDACQDLASRTIYLSGPETMLKELYDELTAHDIPSSRIITDYFPGY